MKTRRFIAYLIDGYLVLFLSIYFAKFIWKKQFIEILIKIVLVNIFLQLLYYFILEYFFRKTLGKLITKISVKMNNEVNSSFKAILRRTFARLIPFDQVSIFLYTDELMWHDQISNTKVVMDKKRKKND